jgi:small subunit ribosomal protein S4
MARYIGPVCKLCRREGMELYLKGDRCYTEKCSFKRRPRPPGQHGEQRVKFSEYGLRLREKQKVRRIYGVLERQFRKYFAEADRTKGVTGENLLALLERRLDNVVYRLGFAATRNEARQLVLHCHITVNGKRVNIPSFHVRPGATVEVVEKSRKVLRISEALETVDRRGVPQWVELDKKAFKGVVRQAPNREDLTMPIQEQLIVELYSK